MDAKALFMSEFPLSIRMRLISRGARATARVGGFFYISFPLLRRAFSARTRERSICSGSFAMAPIPWPSLTRLTASSLNSAVYSGFGILNNFSPSSQLSLTPLPGR